MLEDHLQKLREEDVSKEQGDDDTWNDWDVESDVSDESESEGWMDVDSEGEDNLEISDSEDEQENVDKGKKKTPDEPKLEEAPDHNRPSILATTKVQFLDAIIF